MDEEACLYFDLLFSHHFLSIFEHFNIGYVVDHPTFLVM